MATTPIPAKRGRKPAAATAQQAGGQVQSLTRGLKLLEWIAESHSSVALTELAQQAGFDHFFCSFIELICGLGAAMVAVNRRSTKA